MHTSQICRRGLLISKHTSPTQIQHPEPLSLRLQLVKTALLDLGAIRCSNHLAIPIASPTGLHQQRLRTAEPHLCGDRLMHQVDGQGANFTVLEDVNNIDELYTTCSLGDYHV